MVTSIQYVRRTYRQKRKKKIKEVKTKTRAIQIKATQIINYKIFARDENFPLSLKLIDQNWHKEKKSWSSQFLNALSLELSWVPLFDPCLSQPSLDPYHLSLIEYAFIYQQ